MGETTSISWTDATFNPVIGCTKVSPGCDNCYAETMDHRWGGDHWGKGKERRVTSDAYWKQPLKWDREAMAAGVVKKVFCGSQCDVMDDEWPDGVRGRLWELIDKTPNLLWQLLTKRPHRYIEYLPDGGFAHRNVILGTTIESQQFYGARIRQIKNAGRLFGLKTFVSYEPALGPITMRESERPDWVIFGGETGANPRPMERSWAENIRNECVLYRIPFFMKQFSASTPTKAAALIPADLLMRDFPS